jgi:hypothetical protein
VRFRLPAFLGSHAPVDAPKSLSCWQFWNPFIPGDIDPLLVVLRNLRELDFKAAGPNSPGCQGTAGAERRIITFYLMLNNS